MPPVIGIVGGGQLARMMMAPAARLALPVVLLADPDDAAAPFCRDLIPGVPDAVGLRRLAEACDVLTVEHELVDLETLAELEAEGHVVRPSSATLAIAVDKARQRQVLADHGIPLAPFVVTDDLTVVERFGEAHGWPLVCKPPRGGYDGRGVFVVDGPAGVRELFDQVGGELLVEPRLPIELELSVLVARRPAGEMVTYPPVETVQVDGMCREVRSPAAVDDRLRDAAVDVARRVAEAVDSVGILAVELFVVDGEVLLNELAARPHNAGHVTIEGSITSQFENHLRAVADLPLGETGIRHPAVMVNVVGGDHDPVGHLADALTLRDVSVHLYGKSYRPGRKLGHVTATADDLATAGTRANDAATVLTEGSAS